MADSERYADSAQARLLDRLMEGHLPGNSTSDFFHEIDQLDDVEYRRFAKAQLEAEAQRKKAEWQRLKPRIDAAITYLVGSEPPTQQQGAQQGAQGVVMSQSQDLVTLPAKEVALTVFSTLNGLDPYLQSVRDELDKFIASAPDVKTKKGQGAYRSIAYDLATSRSKLDNLGKDLVAELKDLPKKIDAERKRVRELLADWQEDVRKPLTDWEAAESARKKGHNDSIQWLQGLVDGVAELPADQIAKRIEDAEGFVIGVHMEEFEVDAARAKDASLSSLRTSLSVRLKHEAELAEIARFNAEKAERERVEHEAAIARAATEKAQREAAERAEADRLAAAKREQELVDQAEKQRLQLQLQAEQAERAADQAKADKEAAERKAEQDRIEADRRQTEAVEQARLNEIARREAVALEEKRHAAAREADKAHQAKVNRAALEAFVAAGMTDACARQAVTLIAQRKIPAVTITY